MGKERQKRTQTIPFDRACELAGGEEELKKARDPVTGKLLFPQDYRNHPRSRWYNYKSRGFPAYLMIPILVAQLESPQPDRQAVEAIKEVTETIHEVARLYRQGGARSKYWKALRALLRAALS
jgi:hypothetical protein